MQWGEVDVLSPARLDQIDEGEDYRRLDTPAYYYLQFDKKHEVQFNQIIREKVAD